MSYKTGFKDIEFSLSYEKIKRRVDAQALLQHYGARNVYRKGEEWIHSCLIDRIHPHHSNGDESPSAALNEEKLLYSCYSYGGGDILWFIQEMEDTDRAGALDVLSEFISNRWEEEGLSVIEMIKNIMKEQDVPEAVPTYSPIILKPWQGIHPYLTEDRGLRFETLERFRVGYDERERVIIFPHFWKGKLVGYQKRALTSNDYPKTKPDKNGLIPKYKNTPGFPKDSTIFNLDLVQSRGCQKVIVVESVMSVLKAESWFDMSHLNWGNVVCTFGGKVTDSQIELLREFDQVVLLMDNDTSGWSGTVHLYEGLKAFCKVFIAEVPEGIDLADLDQEIASEVVESARFGPLAINTYKKRLEEVKR